MKRIGEAKRRRGVALLTTLALIIFLAAMIAAAVRGNMEQRRYLRLRRSQTAALCLAESGVAEALRAIALRNGENRIETTVSLGRRFRVEWREEGAGTRTYEIRSLGVNGTEDLAFARRTVTVRAQVFAGRPAQVLSWSVASAQ